MHSGLRYIIIYDDNIIIILQFIVAPRDAEENA